MKGQPKSGSFRDSPVLLKKSQQIIPHNTRLFPGINRFAAGRIGHRNHFNFDISAFGQAGNLDSRAGGWIGFKIGAVEFVDGLEVRKIGQENRRLDDVFES